MSGFLTRPDTKDYPEIRFDPNKNDPIYIGKNMKLSSSVDDMDWKIIKISSDRIQTAYGSWTNRVSYF